MIIKNGVLIEVTNEDIIDGKFEIPNDVIKIDHKAFENTTSLESIEIPESVKVIEDSAFKNSGIKKLAFAGDIDYIYPWAFANCENLEIIVFPKNIEYVGCDVFNGCKSLREIKIPSNFAIANFKGTERCNGGSAFYDCKNLKNVILEDSMEVIPESFFGKCKSLREIYLPENVKSIEELAFVDCYSLEKINIPDGITRIAESCFEDCISLKSIYIPESVKTIEYGVFYGCRNLEQINISDDVYIYSEVFEDTEKLDLTEFNTYSRLENLRENWVFRYSENYGFDSCDKFCEKVFHLLGIEELEKLASMPELTEEDIKRYSLEKEEAIQELYETKAKITGDLGVTLEILRNLKLGEKQKKDSGKNNLEIQMLKYINEQLENGYNGSLKDLVKNSLGENVDEKTINNIIEIEKRLNKKLIIENLSKITTKIENSIGSTNEQYSTPIVRNQIEPIRKMIEDTIISEFSKNGNIDNIDYIIFRKLEDANAPYIRQNARQVMEMVSNLFRTDNEVNEILDKNCVNSLKNIKESIGTGWKFKLNQTLQKLGYSFESLPEELSKDEAIKIIDLLNEKSEKKIEVELSSISVPKEGKDRKEACKILAGKGLPKLVTYMQLHDMFGSVKEPYSQEFRKYYQAHREEFLYNPENWQYFGVIANNFDQIINSPEIKNIYIKGELKIDGIKTYLQAKIFTNVREENQDLAVKAKTIGGIATEEEFEFVQDVFEITKRRERTSVPPVEVKKTKYRGRMLAPDDVLNLFAGNITTCCQKFGDIGEASMLIGAIEENAGIFVIEELDENGKVINIIGQSLTIRQESKDGQFDRLTFDNIEITKSKKANLSLEDEKEILEIYKETAKQALEKDKKFLKKQLKNGKITQEQYDKLVLKEVIAGRGYNDLNGLDDLEAAESVPPREAFYKYKFMNGMTDYAWIDSTERFNSTRF